MENIEDLLSILVLEQTQENTFLGKSKTVGSPNVFGGQVLAQSLNAASRTIHNKRILHSMHSYFLEAGNLEIPITYEVTVMRDGGSFSVRRVTALQNETVIFILSASFHKKEKGHDHQINFPEDIKQPEELMGWDDMYENYMDVLPDRLKSFLEISRPVEFKPTQLQNPFEKVDLPPISHVWFKVKGDTSKLDMSIKQQIITYISDYNILAVALHRHGSTAHWGNTQTASLDHSMWYYRDFDLEDWMLYSMESPSTSNARGFVRGNIFTRDGKLVASVAQEGLLRPKNKS
ncbi:acyl-CoA thioesterase-2 [Flavobacteriaceae bacterium MAR_2010_188]|nr:acyl-CoA thioesterase-2 [Flavobacteriaceae bacterium MAR_2010_188]